MRVRLTVAYDGTNYCGWQVQKNGVSIQQVLNEALSDFFGQEIAVVGASRTDAGVHALGNVAAFDVDTRMAADKIAYAINQSLPPDIVVVESAEADPEFHPRFCRGRKTYEYRILNREFPEPTKRLYTYFYHYPLDEGAMAAATAYLVGEHDFTSFSSIHAQTRSFVRTIYSCRVTRDEEDVVTIRITGSGFLYNMVRIIAGTLIEVGNGKYAPAEVGEMLRARNRAFAGPTAPACGLTLMEIVYDEP